MYQGFAVRLVCEKYIAKVFWTFVELEKGFDTIDKRDMWQMLGVHEVGENC